MAPACADVGHGRQRHSGVPGHRNGLETASLKRLTSRATFRGQAGADQFPVIAGKDVFVGVGGM
jgi:hypothetical protein